jgi:transposase-like protein
MKESVCIVLATVAGLQAKVCANQIHVNNQRYWLYAAVNPETNECPHVRRFSSRTTVLTTQFVQKLTERRDVANNMFLIDGVPKWQAVLVERGTDFSMSPTEIGLPSNATQRT